MSGDELSNPEENISLSQQEEDEEEVPEYEDEEYSPNVEEEVPEYEKKRLEMIEENKGRMEAMGLHKMETSLMGAAEKVSKMKKHNDKNKGMKKMDDQDEEYYPNEDDDCEGMGSSTEGGEKVIGVSAPGKEKVKRKSSTPLKRGPTKRKLKFNSEHVDDNESLLQENARPISNLKHKASCEPPHHMLGARHNGLPTLYAHGPDRLWPKNAVTEVGEIIRREVEPRAWTWRAVSNRLKSEHFNELKKSFYVPTESESVLFEVFKKVASSLYTNAVYKWKLNKLRGKPECIRQEDWSDWLAYWDRKDVKDKSEKARLNRLTEVDGPGSGISKSFGGSQATFVTQRLAEEKGHPMALYEIFCKTKKREDGSWTDIKARKIGEVVEKIMEETKRDLTLQEKNAIFLKVNPPSKKQRIYGIGSAATRFVSLGNNIGLRDSAPFYTNEDPVKMVRRKTKPTLGQAAGVDREQGQGGDVEAGP